MEMGLLFHQNWGFSCPNILVSFCLTRTFHGNLPNLYNLSSCSIFMGRKKFSFTWKISEANGKGYLFVLQGFLMTILLVDLTTTHCLYLIYIENVL